MKYPKCIGQNEKKYLKLNKYPFLLKFHLYDYLVI